MDQGAGLLSGNKTPHGDIVSRSFALKKALLHACDLDDAKKIGAMQRIAVFALTALRYLIMAWLIRKSEALVAAGQEGTNASHYSLRYRGLRPSASLSPLRLRATTRQARWTFLIRGPAPPRRGQALLRVT
jgi:hypothetical protein